MRLFQNCGWDYWIDPTRYDDKRSAGKLHVPVQQFNDLDEQVQSVNDMIDQISKSAALERDHMQAIEWSLNEIMDNVLNHADSKPGGFVQLSVFSAKRTVEFLVADAGVGIARSLGIKDPKIALEKAITEGVTRNEQTNQGNGLYGVYRIALVTNGQFNLQSGLGNMYLHQGSVRFLEETVPYMGTFVRWSISLRSSDIINRALVIGGQSRKISFDYFDKISSQLNDTISIVMKDEFTSFGSREAGRRAYNKVSNFLNWGNTETIEIDFENIGIISSSFADELFGRLFAEMGPIVFMKRVQFANAAPEILGIIDLAMTKRIKAEV